MTLTKFSQNRTDRTLINLAKQKMSREGEFVLEPNLAICRQSQELNQNEIRQAVNGILFVQARSIQ